MEKKVLAAASFDKQMYYIEKEFEDIPENIKDEIKAMCILLAQKLMCTFIIGFYTDGQIYFETIKSEELIDFDDIGAELEIKALKKEKEELIKALNLWYIVFKTPEGEKIKEKIMKNC